MELFLIRFLCGATLLLIAGLLGATVLRKRGPAASCVVLRAVQAGLLLCAIAAALPAPVRPLTAIEFLEAAVIAPEEEIPMQSIEAPAMRAMPEARNLEPVVPIDVAEPPVKPLPWKTIVPGVWIAGALIGLGRLLVGHLLLRRLRRMSQPVDLGEVYPVELRESAVILTPVLAGCVRSVLYLPQSGLLRESPEALQMALAHELAHHKRHDLAWSLVAQLLRAILWFHPLVHLVAYRQEFLAEQASDEAALQQLPGRQAYAKLLLSLSEISTPHYAPLTAGMASHRSRVAQRIRHLLSAPLSLPLSLKGRIGIATGTVIMLFAGTALIGYAKKPPAAPPVPTGHIVRAFVRSAVNLSVTNRPLREVTAEVSRQSKYKITVDPALRGNITLSLRGKDCEEVLKRLCSQILPAAWYAPINIGKETGMEYLIAPLPPVGKLSGRLVSSEGKPVPGVHVFCAVRPDGSGKEIPLALHRGDTAITDAQGRFTLSRIAKWPYEILFHPDFEAGFAQKRIKVAGIPGRMVTLPAIPLEKGAQIEFQYSDHFRFGAFRLEASALIRRGVSAKNTMTLLVPPGESRFVPNKYVRSYRILSHTGAGEWQVKNGALLISLKGGEHAKFVVDAQFTPEKERQSAAQKLFFERQIEKSKYDRELMRRKMARVNIETQPQPFLEAVKKLCQQARQVKVVIDPGIGGIVKSPESPRLFEPALKAICLQAAPVAYPIWEEDVLHIVRAPERGKFDKKTHLYRLGGLDKEAVFQELPGRFHGGMGGGLSWRNLDRAVRARVVVTDYMTQKPLPGITIVHETPGKIRRIQTDARGRCQLNLIAGPNYYYIQPDKEWIQYGQRSRDRRDEVAVELELMRRSELANNRENDWRKPISFQVSEMPARQAIRKLFQLIGEENVALPGNLTGSVTVDAKNQTFAKVFAMVSRQVKPYLIPELRQKITVRALPR